MYRVGPRHRACIPCLLGENDVSGHRDGMQETQRVEGVMGDNRYLSEMDHVSFGSCVAMLDKLDHRPRCLSLVSG